MKASDARAISEENDADRTKAIKLLPIAIAEVKSAGLCGRYNTSFGHRDLTFGSASYLIRRLNDLGYQTVNGFDNETYLIHICW